MMSSLEKDRVEEERSRSAYKREKASIKTFR